MSIKCLFRLLPVALTVILLAVGIAYAVDCNYSSCTAKYGKGYCTDYIASHSGGIRISGNAKDWYKNANDPKGKEPKANSVAVFGATSSNPYGHVAWVEQVDGDRFKVSHWNWGSIDKNDPYAVCCGKTDKYGKDNPKWFNKGDAIGFIYRSSAKTEHTYYIRITNIDDEGTCKINGNKVASVGYYGDTGWVNVTNKLHSGNNEIKFKVKNNQEGYAYYFGFKEDNWTSPEIADTSKG